MTIRPTADAVDFDVFDHQVFEQVDQLRTRYRDAAPFPHIVLDGLIDRNLLDVAMTEFPPVDGSEWTSYVHVNERKYGNPHLQTWGPALQQIAEELMSDRFVSHLCRLTGIDGLRADRSMDGGGLHQSFAGGFLNVHADFTSHHTNRMWRRRVNLLLYCNADWRPEYNGDLELWDAGVTTKVASISPNANRIVIFNTDVDSFHGVPDPIACPPGMARQSMALYYFTEESSPISRSTEYRARPGDGAKGILIYLDKKALRVYDVVKRRLGISDAAISRVLKRVRRP